MVNRSAAVIRHAQVADAPQLAEIWHGVTRRAAVEEQITDLELVVKQAMASPDERLLVAEVGGEAVGAVFLRVATISPINLEPTVQAISPHVLPTHRRRGIGTLLMEQAVNFAEELGIAHVATAADSGSREANRFMARLSLASKATIRVGITAALRSRLNAQRPGNGESGRQRSRILAVRRSQRRSLRQ